jgi:hypothetical protein
MRDFKGMKRQRNRGRGGGGGGGGGGGKPQHNANRAFDSNGPEGVKVRGAAQHVYEKYQQLARDATTSGDRVLAENYLQHAEHYFRLMRAMQPMRPLSDIIGRDQFVSGFDIDFEEEPQTGDGAEAEAEGESAEAGDSQGDRPAYRGDYRQDTRPRDDGYRQDRWSQDRNGQDRPYNDRAQNDRPPRTGRDDRPRFQRDDRPVRAERSERDAGDPLGVVEPEATPLTAPAPLAPAPILRADDGEVSHAPAFLQARAPDAADERRPRRRRPTPVSGALDPRTQDDS